MAGLRHSEGDLVIIMDDDFQNPPEEALKLALYSLSNDHDVVFTKYRIKNDSLIRNIMSKTSDDDMVYYAMINSYNIIIEEHLGDDLIGVEDFLSQDQVSISPNPTNNEINIIVQQQVEADIRIFDVLGKLMVYQTDISLGNNNHTIDISNFSNGVYFVRINSDAGTITKKIMKK
jgi:hypothetical protein